MLSAPHSSCKHAYHLIVHSCLHVRTSHPFQIQVICVYMESRCNLIQTVRPHLPGAILVEGEVLPSISTSLMNCSPETVSEIWKAKMVFPDKSNRPKQNTSRHKKPLCKGCKQVPLQKCLISHSVTGSIISIISLAPTLMPST